jgi:hypothetical protein
MLAQEKNGVSRRNALQWSGGFLGVAALGAVPLSGLTKTTAKSLPLPIAVPLPQTASASLAQLPATRAAGQHFGSPDWAMSQSVKFSGSGDAEGFVIPLKPAAGSEAVTLALARKSSASPYLALVASSKPSAHGLTISVYTPGGESLGTVQTTGSGQRSVTMTAGADAAIQASQLALTGTAEPDLSRACMLNCINENAPQCLEVCSTCVDFASCMVCATCAGFALVGCIAACAVS